MGSSFVSIGKKGFWMRDGALELWLRLLALHIKEPTTCPSRVCEIRNQWLLASRGYFGGFIPVKLDEAVADEEGRQIVVAAIKSLMTALEKGPATLDPGTLNLIGFTGSVWTKPYESNLLLEVGNAFLALIDGRITTTVADTSFMPGKGI
jgi:hypothetical protein